jgi:hypothetical protein
MKTLKQACKIRESVVDETQRDDTLDLSNITNGNIDEDRFFAETFITNGMELLFDTAFKRFRGEAGTGLVKLTQAMGGGKTHNMVALGILARNPKFRKEILGGKYNDYKEEVEVISYTGRESDLEYGIWGEIAKQLGKEDLFSPYYSPLKAPGQSAWVNLLKSDKPTLILLDELPPYLEYCKTQQYGTGTLLDITTTALSNLFNALNKEELHNVCLVVSDLDATYQQGSQVIRGMFDNLSNEIERSSTNIVPVSENTDDLYNILRTRLFKDIANDNEIDEIAREYQQSVKELKEMNYTDESPEDIARGIRSSYPFHPSIRDLFARFKENPGFQQTRGFIRLTRKMVKDLYSEGGLANQRYLVNPYDIDLNDNEMVTIIKNIKPELSNAISHDIASDGNAAAEKIDHATDSTDMQDLTKLILMSSLSKVTNSVVGLSSNELIAYLATPGRDITNIKKGLEELKTKAWYLYIGNDNKLFFRKVQNVNAQLNDEVRGFTYEQAKLHIKEILDEKFSPEMKDCYQLVSVFPSIEEIDLKKDKVTLILTEPNKNSTGLSDDIKKFYEDISYKNRVMFLTGQRVAMDNLIDVTKRYKAINNIIYKMVNEDNVKESDSELLQARDLFDKISAKLFSNIRESFITLYFPMKEGLEKKDFKMEFTGNNFNAEKQIRDVLLEEMKFTEEIEPERLKNKFEHRIFSQQRMQWNFLMERVATTTSWQWHNLNALEDLKNYCLNRGLWIESGGYLDKEPPAPKTSVNVIETHRDENTGEVTLKINAVNGDTVYYEIEGDATEASMKVEDLSSFKTKELRLSLLCVDSRGKNKTGDQFKWENKVDIKYKEFDKDGHRCIELKPTSNKTVVKYTTDGSNPVNNGGIYLEPFEIPKGCQYVRAVAVSEDLGYSSENYEYKITSTKFEIDDNKEVNLTTPLKPSNTKYTYEMLDSFKGLDVKMEGLEFTIQEKGSNSQGFIMLNIGSGIPIKNVEKVIDELNQILDKYFEDKQYDVTSTINHVNFNNGRTFKEWVSRQRLTIEEFKNKVVQR